MSARRYYDDLVVGETRESHEETVELDALLAFARAYDPQYFHADPAAARDSVFGEVIASGIPSAASMTYDSKRNRLVIPMNDWNAMAIVELNQP